MMRRATWIIAAALSLTVIAPVSAQDTAATVRLVIGFAPGATTDAVARQLASKLSQQMNANVVVDNKPGANGNIGGELVAKSRADGTTLLLNTSSVILSPALGDPVSYDVFKDLTPVSLVASSPQILIVNPALPVNTPAEFIAYVRANPNKLSYGSAGVGNITHLGPLLMLQANGLSALHVPYKGASLAAIDLVAGRIQFRFSDLTSVLPMINDKRVKPIATAGLRRSALLPDVPTFSETVMPGFEVGSWFGVMLPANAPATLVKKYNGELIKALQDADVKAKLAQDNVDPIGSSPEEYAAYLKSEYQRWNKLIKSAGIKPE
jgi:tripartite-type tricarboxylate transporter receptor subunit TctC